LILLLVSSLVENGAGTGWTVWILLVNNFNHFSEWYTKFIDINLDKLLYYSDIVIVNPTRCKENLILWCKCWLWNKILIKGFTNKKNICLENYFINIIHQRLNVGPLIQDEKRPNLRALYCVPLLEKIRTWKVKALLPLVFCGGRAARFISTFNTNKTSLSENKSIFNEWLVGFTDGDGSFSVIFQNNKWSLVFKLSQSTYNLRVLHFIKTQLGVGRVTIDKGEQMASFVIRDLNTINSVIIPIFDTFPLLTSKYFKFLIFKKAAIILSNKNLSKVEKDKLIWELKSTFLPLNYVSPAWSVVNNLVFNHEMADKVMTKAWLVGFTEAEGSFYLVKKESNRLVHGFEITKKLDEIVLISIKYLLHITTNVQHKKAGYYSISTTNSRAIENIISYYKNTMKGMKSVEYRIWSRSYAKFKGNYIALDKIRTNIRIMRKQYQTFNTE